MLDSKIERCTRHISFPKGDYKLIFVLLHHKCTWYTCLVTFPFVEVPPHRMSIHPGLFRTIPIYAFCLRGLLVTPPFTLQNASVWLILWCSNPNGSPDIWEGLGRHVFTRCPALLFTSGWPCSKHLFKESQSDSLSWKFAPRPMELKSDGVAARSVTLITQSHIFGGKGAKRLRKKPCSGGGGVWECVWKPVFSH